MAKELSSLLKKKTWTGREVGLALLKTIDDQMSERKRNPKQQTFTPADIQRMLKTLDNNDDIAVYNEYCAIYSSVIDSFNLIQAMIQQFYNGYNKYVFALQLLKKGEDYYRTVCRFPLIMTQKEFDDRRAAKEKELQANEESLASLILDAAATYYDEGKAPAAVKKAIDDLADKPITRKRILDTYRNKKYRYIFENGMDSETTDHDKIAEYLTDACGGGMERLKAYYKVFFEGEAGLQALYKRNTGKSIPKGKLKRAEYLFEFLVQAADRGGVLLFSDMEDAPIVSGLFVEPVKVKIEEMLEEYDGDMQTELEYVREEYSADHSDGSFSEFIEDYPALYKALRADVEKHFPAAKKIKDLDKPFITWGELAKADYLNFAELCEIRPDEIYRIMEGKRTDSEGLLEWRRASGAGIAIYQGEEYNDPTKGGLHVEQIGGIEHSMKNPDLLEDTKDAIDVLILPALRFVYAYNEVLAALRDVYEIPFLQDCYIDMTDHEGKIENVDTMLFQLYHDIFGTDDEKAKKRAFLRKYLTPIGNEELKPTEEDREKLREKLRKAKGTTGARELIKKYELLILDTMPGGGETSWREQVQ